MWRWVDSRKLDRFFWIDFSPHLELTSFVGPVFVRPFEFVELTPSDVLANVGKAVFAGQNFMHLRRSALGRNRVRAQCPLQPPRPGDFNEELSPKVKTQSPSSKQERL